MGDCSWLVVGGGGVEGAGHSGAVGEVKSTAPGAHPQPLLCDPEWLGTLFEPQFSHLQSKVHDGKRNKRRSGAGAELP